MKNFDRMLQLAEEVFYTRDDEGQITVSPEERAMLEAIHPAALSGMDNEDGPIVWILLLPTTTPLMQQFIAGSITEVELLQRTAPGTAYNAIYLCSALVLPEYQNQGLASKVALAAIDSICSKHKIEALFYWPFTNEGKLLASSLSKKTGLPLLEKTGHK